MVLHEAVLRTGSIHHSHIHPDGVYPTDACLSGKVAEMVHVPDHHHDLGFRRYGKILRTLL